MRDAAAVALVGSPVHAAEGAVARTRGGKRGMTDLSSKPFDTRTKEERARDPEFWVHRGMDAYRRGDTPLPFRPDAAFFELADFVVIPKRTLLGYSRLY